MNKNLRELLVRVEYKHQIWYEVISIERFHDTQQQSFGKRSPGKSYRPVYEYHFNSEADSLGPRS